MISRITTRPARAFLLAGAVTVTALLISGCGGGSEPGTPEEAAGHPEEASTVPDTTPATPDAPSGPLGTASIRGTINYEGEVPQLKPIRMDADPICAAKHDGPVVPEILVLGDGNTLGNVYIRVKSGVEGNYSASAEPAVLDQVGCAYSPHVMGLMVGQTLKILNSDSLLHNVHSLSKVNSPFNRAMPGSVKQAEFTFDKEEGVFRVKCDVHPWMSAFVGVSAHPFFDVSESTGSYSLDNLPAGTYEIEAWHERLGEQTASVTVADGEAAVLDLTFTR